MGIRWLRGPGDAFVKRSDECITLPPGIRLAEVADISPSCGKVLRGYPEQYFARVLQFAWTHAPDEVRLRTVVSWQSALPDGLVLYIVRSLQDVGQMVS